MAVSTSICCSAVHRPSQRSASAIAARCIVLRSAVRLSHDLGATSAGLACLRMSGSPACIHQMTDKSRPMLLLFSKSRPCPRDRNASSFAGKLFCPSRAALVIGAKSTSIRPGGHLDINSALLTRSRLCAWECLATCGQNAFSVNPARKYAFPELGLADTWAKRGMLNRSVNFTSRLALTATLVTEKPSALA